FHFLRGAVQARGRAKALPLFCCDLCDEIRVQTLCDFCAQIHPKSMAMPIEQGSDTSGAVAGSVSILLRLEGLVVAVASLALYARTGASWWLFAVLWLAPDLSMVGYLRRPCL